MEAKMRIQDKIVTNAPTNAKDTNNGSTASKLNNEQGKLCLWMLKLKSTRKITNCVTLD